jgi:hypothetical protein
MNQEQRRQLETELVAMGLNGINDGDVIPVFAHLVESFPYDKHWFYRGMLNECEPHRRREMYDSLKPHFNNFRPKPFEAYMAEISEEAMRMISHGVMRVEGARPDAIVVGNEYFVSADDKVQTHVVVKLTCAKCQRRKLFVGDTLVGAMQAARKKGWVRNQEREICPKCPAVRVRIGNA